MPRLLLLLPALLAGAPAFAQPATPSCQAVAAENAALRDQVAAYEARLGLNAAGVTVRDGDAQLPIKFVSCKASRSTHTLTVAVLVTNAGPPTRLTLFNTYTGEVSTVVDEAGQGYRNTSATPPMMGASQYAAELPTGVPVRCTLTVEAVPATVTRLGAVVLSMERGTPGKDKQVAFKTTLQHLPVTWVP